MRSCGSGSPAASWVTGWRRNEAKAERRRLDDRRQSARDNYRRAVGHAVIEIDDVLVDEPHATRRNGFADRPPFRRAVQAVERVLVVLEDVKRASPERVRDARLHAALPDVRAWDLPCAISLQLGLAVDHFVGREPARPPLFPLDHPAARPLETLTAEANAVA